MRKGQKSMFIPGSSTSGFSVLLCGVLNMRTFPTVGDEKNIVKSVRFYSVKYLPLRLITSFNF